jgi:hypothetical protein
VKTIGEGAEIYDDGKNQLQLAINEYDQAIIDLTASIVAGMSTEVLLTRHQQFIPTKNSFRVIIKTKRFRAGCRRHIGWSKRSFMPSENKEPRIPYNGYGSRRSFVIGRSRMPVSINNELCGSEVLLVLENPH